MPNTKRPAGKRPPLIAGIPLKRKPSRHKLLGRQYLPSLKQMIGEPDDLFDFTLTDSGFLSTEKPRIAYAIYHHLYRWRVDVIEWVSGSEFKRTTTTGEDDPTIGELSAEEFIKQLKSNL